MKKYVVAISILVVAALSTVAYTQSEEGPKEEGQGWGPDSTYQLLYDADRSVTLKGEVRRIEDFVPGKEMSRGVRLELFTGAQVVTVHLGPRRFVKSRNLNIEMGDEIVIKGSRATFDMSPVVMASSVRKGSAEVRLRDYDGYPLWARKPEEEIE